MLGALIPATATHATELPGNRAVSDFELTHDYLFELEGENRLLARAIDANGKNGVHAILIVRDDRGPKALSCEPANGASGLARQPTIAVRFSEAMAAPPTADAWQLVVHGSAVDASAVVRGEEIRFQPDQPLPPASEVELTLDPGPTDLAGNALTNPQTWSFTTTPSGIDPPTISAPPPSPSFVCAASRTFAGTTTPRAMVRIEGGATT